MGEIRYPLSVQIPPILKIRNPSSFFFAQSTDPRTYSPPLLKVPFFISNADQYHLISLSAMVAANQKIKRSIVLLF